MDSSELVSNGIGRAKFWMDSEQVNNLFWFQIGNAPYNDIDVSTHYTQGGQLPMVSWLQLFRETVDVRKSFMGQQLDLLVNGIARALFGGAGDMRKLRINSLSAA
jgi:hypothetical protein